MVLICENCMMEHVCGGAPMSAESTCLPNWLPASLLFLCCIAYFFEAFHFLSRLCFPVLISFCQQPCKVPGTADFRSCQCRGGVQLLSHVISEHLWQVGTPYAGIADLKMHTVKPFFKTTWEIGTTWELRTATSVHRSTQYIEIDLRNKTTSEFRTVFHSPLGIPNSQVPL